MLSNAIINAKQEQCREHCKQSHLNNGPHSVEKGFVQGVPKKPPKLLKMIYC